MLIILMGLAILAGIAYIVYQQSRPAIPSGRGYGNGSVSLVRGHEGLELVEHEPVNINFFNYVTGTVRNNTDQAYRHVRVSIEVYNKGVRMGETYAGADNLEPGGQWHFQVPVLEQGAFEYKITQISGS